MGLIFTVSTPLFPPADCLEIDTDGEGRWVEEDNPYVFDEEGCSEITGECALYKPLQFSSACVV